MVRHAWAESTRKPAKVSQKPETCESTSLKDYLGTIIQVELRIRYERQELISSFDPIVSRFKGGSEKCVEGFILPYRDFII